MAQDNLVSGSCPLCHSPEVRARFEVPSSPGHSVVACAACGFLWTSPPLEGPELAAWYPNEYYGEGNVRFWSPLEGLIRSFRRRRARWIRRHAPLGRALDVGCGRGQLLASLRSLGYEVCGVELSETAAWHAREVVGARVEVGNLLDLDLGKECFDLVIFWHSLEHFNQPMEVLQKARALLKPGGSLVIAVPNSDSLQARLSGRHWFHLDTPRHRSHFGAESLRRVLEAIGVEVVVTRHLGLEQNPYGFLQSLYNLLGFQHNLLYSILKNRSARTTPTGAYRVQTALLAGSLPLIGPMAGALWLVESSIRRGGTVEMIARKRAPEGESGRGGTVSSHE